MSALLLASIAIRLAALAWCLRFLWHLRDWRLGFLAAMIALMALRQGLTATKTPTILPLSFSANLDELPGLLVSVLAFLAVFFVGRFIRERRRAEQKLKETQALFEQAADIAGLGHWEWDVSGERMLSCSEGMPKILGLKSVAEYIFSITSMKASVAWLVPEDQQSYLESVQAAIDERRGYDLDYRIIRTDGARRHIRELARPVIDDTGALVRFVGTIQDITGLVDAKKAAAEARERFVGAIESLSDGFALYDADDRLVMCNGPYRDLAGTEAELVTPGSQFETYTRQCVKQGLILDAAGREEAWLAERMERHRNPGEPFEVRRTDRWLEVREQRLADGSTIVMPLDTTMRKRAEESLRRNQARLAYAQRQAKLAHWSSRYEDYEIEHWSDQAAEILGIDPRALRDDESYLGFVHPEDRDRVRSFYALDKTQFPEAENYSIDYRFLRPDGRTIWLREVGELERDGDGRPLRYNGTIQDITGQVEIEAHLREAQKLEAIGQLTGGIAHDFNNLLAIILGNLELIDEHVLEDPSVRELIEPAVSAGRRGADLTERLLAFARRQPLAPELVDLNQLASSMVKLLARTLGETIEIEFAQHDALWQTVVDPNQMENALINLAVNARDAMPEGGKLVIETSNADLSGREAEQNVEGRAGHYVVLTVTDSGTGMPEEILDQVFEPFFTTKDMGRGSGLGLSMVFGFVKQSGGHVKFESKLGHGTTVRIYLPRAGETEPEEAGAGLRLGRVYKGHGQRILLVEDDADFRSTAQRMLEGLGYNVVNVEDGPSALAVLEQGAPVDLLLTDLDLHSGITGVELAVKATELRPALKVLYMSGHGQVEGVGGGASDPDVELIAKPFQRSDLGRRVHRALNGTTS